MLLLIFQRRMIGVGAIAKTGYFTVHHLLPERKKPPDWSQVAFGILSMSLIYFCRPNPKFLPEVPHPGKEDRNCVDIAKRFIHRILRKDSTTFKTESQPFYDFLRFALLRTRIRFHCLNMGGLGNPAQSGFGSKQRSRQRKSSARIKYHTIRQRER